MSNAILLRKVRGISGLTALFRNAGHSSFSMGSGSASFAIPFHPLMLLVLSIVAIVAWLFIVGVEPGSAFALGGLPFVGSLDRQLKEKQDTLAAKQATLAGIFEKAGPDVDFSKSEVMALAGASSSAEVVEKVRSMNAELETLGKERDGIAQLKKIQDGLKTPANQPPIPGSNNSDREVKRQSLGQVITGSKAYQLYCETKTASSSTAEGFGVPELKTLFETAAGWAPESTRTGLLVDKATRPIQVLDIIPSGSTKQAAVVFMEETTRTHSAAERAEAAAYAESAFALTERSETVRSIGDSLPVTDEQLEDVEGIQSYLDQRLMFGIRQRLDGQVLAGSGVAPNLTGVLNKAGIQTQAKGADPTPDAVYKAMVKVRVTGRAFPNAFIVHPNDWQDIRLLRTADGIYIWGSPSESGPERIWGIQAVQSDALTENTGIVGDFANFCQLYERKGIEVAVGYVGSQFTEGKRTIRAGMRVAFAIYRAAAFATVTGI